MPPPGLLLINKPAGPTSHDIVDIARQKLGIKTIGHTGTLDPFASGLLILLIGREATKHQSRFLKMDKQYLATALFGYISDTYDITGKIQQLPLTPSLHRVSLPFAKGEIRWGSTYPHQRIPTLKEIKQTLNKFKGNITQTVPPFSAVKVKGKRLYKLARRGDLVDRPNYGQAPDLPLQLPQRQVTIHQFQITNQSPPPNPWIEKFKRETTNLKLETLFIHCSSGTYIRSLIHDLGHQLGCGALVAALHRTHIGPYSVAPALATTWLTSSTTHPCSPVTLPPPPV